MITKIPCCSNCPHFDPDPDFEGRSGECLFDVAESFTHNANSRCGHHPFIVGLPEIMEGTWNKAGVNQAFAEYISKITPWLELLRDKPEEDTP